jgi:hypothetical protein
MRVMGRIRGEVKKWELGREAMPARLGDERWQGELFRRSNSNAVK